MMATQNIALLSPRSCVHDLDVWQPVRTCDWLPNVLESCDRHTIFSASFPRKSMGKPAVKVVICYCLLIGFRLVSGGWLKEVPVKGK